LALVALADRAIHRVTVLLALIPFLTLLLQQAEVLAQAIKEDHPELVVLEALVAAVAVRQVGLAALQHLVKGLRAVPESMEEIQEVAVAEEPLLLDQMAPQW
jgi:hypothetical protein